MTAIAATNCTVTVLDKGVVGKKRRTYGTIVFDSTSLTYTGTTGIPLPTYEKWGFMKQVDMIFFNQSTAATVGGFVYKYDKTNHSIRVYVTPGHTIAGSVAAPVFTGVAFVQTAAVTTAPVGSVSAPAFTGTALAVSALTEFTNTTALGASVTLYFDAIGV